MSTYAVAARRWERGWELHVDGVGVTQARRLQHAEAMARDYIEIMTGETGFDVEIHPEVGDGIDAEIAAAREATQAAADAQREAARQLRTAARHLIDRGLKGAEVGIVLGVSQQRVSQLLGTAA
jgi:hypothetical protein